MRAADTHHGGNLAGRGRLEHDRAPREGRFGVGAPGDARLARGDARAAALAGAMVGRGEIKFAILPVAAVVAVVFARVPAAGYVAILWSVGTAIDMLALPEVGVSSLRFEPAEVLLWIALGCLLFLPSDVRRAVRSVAVRRESVTLAVFLLAAIAGVAVGAEHGASVHKAALDMRLMLFYAAFWPALAALARGRTVVFRLVSAGVVVVVVLQVLQVLAGQSTSLFLIAPTGRDVVAHLRRDRVPARAPTRAHHRVHRLRVRARACHLGTGAGAAGRMGDGAVTLTGVILSLNRNMLLGLAFGLCVAALIAPQRHRFVVMAAASRWRCRDSSCSRRAPPSSRTRLSRGSRASPTTRELQATDARRPLLRERHRAAADPCASHRRARLGAGLRGDAPELRRRLRRQPAPPLHARAVPVDLDAGGPPRPPRADRDRSLLGSGTARAGAARGTEQDDAWLGAGVVVALVAMAASSNVAIYLTPPDSTVPLVGVLALAA